MSRSHPLLSQFSHASRRALAWLATLALAVVGVVAVGAPATAAEADAIYSPGSRNAPSTVSGAVFVDREGMPSWINGQDQLLNGVTVYAYWQDEDGAISPTYYDVTRTIDGEDGQYSINVKPWTDANGKTHYFNAAGERLRVWSDNPDPALYSPAYMDSLGGMGTFFEHDASFWGYQVDGVGGGYVNN